MTTYVRQVRQPSPVTAVITDELSADGETDSSMGALKVFAVMTIGAFIGVGIGYLLAVVGMKALTRSLRSRF